MPDRLDRCRISSLGKHFLDEQTGLNQKNCPSPIGVFDSGIGGLSILREVRRLLPHEHLVYVADSAHMPYGDKSREFVVGRSISVSEFLITQGAKVIVVACNTATSAAIATLRERVAVPVIGVEPALKPAAQKTRSGIIGVLATSGTLQGEKFHQLYERFSENVEVLMQPCAGLVEQIEAGALTAKATRALVERYVIPLLDRGADTLVLGCTHYPFVAPLIQAVAGQSVSIIDPSPAVAREVRRRLAEKNQLSGNSGNPCECFWTSGSAIRIRVLMSQLWGDECDVRKLPTEWTIPATGAS